MRVFIDVELVLVRPVVAIGSFFDFRPDADVHIHEKLDSAGENEISGFKFQVIQRIFYIRLLQFRYCI